jgi:NAD(P)-dependent dehydrogenase (short-subunit alcohol dehydrogenase family)
MTQKVWFITGSSRGFGREWTEAALKRGDLVAATARDTDSLTTLVKTYGDSVLPLQLDVTDRAADFAAIKQAHKRFGRLDIVVNNAGYGLFGTIENLSEEQARAQMETNFFGALWVTQAALPYLREQKSGHILQVSSIGGIAAFPILGLYHASKWALEGMSEALAQEVAPFGIHVTLIEPGGFSTDFYGSSSVLVLPSPEYAFLLEARQTTRANLPPGDPRATQKAILTLVDTPNPPLRLFLGSSPLAIARPLYEQRLKTWEQWSEVSKAAQGNG